MTLGEWLATRTPAPPPALAARLRDVLGDALGRDVADGPDLMLAAAERLVPRLLGGGCRARSAALDLLAADALVTYAFEASSAMPTDLAHRAAESMARIAAIGMAAESRE